MAASVSSTNPVQQQAHGALFAIKKSDSSYPSMLESVLGIKSPEQTLYVYSIPSRLSTIQPFEHARLRSIWDTIEVVVLEKETHPDTIIQSIETSSTDDFKETLSKIDSQITTSLKDKLKSKMNEETLKEIDLLFADSSTSIELLRYKTSLLMTLNMSEIPEAKQMLTSLSSHISPSEQIIAKAKETGKELDFIDEPLWMDQDILSFVWTSLLDGPLFEPFMKLVLSHSNSFVPEEQKEELFEQFLKSKEADQLSRKAHTFSLTREKFLCQKVDQYFSSGKKTLFVLEGICSQKALQQRLFMFDAVNSSLGSKITFKHLREEPVGCFWKIKQAGKTAGYLLGSIHVTPSYLSDLNTRINKCFDKSTRVAFEITHAEPNDSSETELESTILKKSLRKYFSLTLEQKEQIIKRLQLIFPDQASKIDWNNEGERLKFIVCSGRALKRKIYANLKLNSGIDLELMKRAQVNGKPIEELETLEQYAQQKTTLEGSLEVDVILEFLASELSNKNTQERVDLLLEKMALFIEAGISPLFDAWEGGDLDCFDSSQKDSKEHKIDMTQRNFNMAKKINDLFTEQERVFCCIGAAHTVGNMSVPAFLQSFGYTIERVLP